MQSYEKRMARTRNAVEMKPVDKIPYSYSGAAYVARDQNVLMKDFVTDYERAVTADIDFVAKHPGIDTMHSPIFTTAALSTLWLSNVKSPGVELSDDELWQVDEKEVITEEDYQTILDIGYGPWVNQVLTERLGDPFTKMAGFISYMPTALQRLAEAGIPIMNDAGNAATPFEGFCGGRTLMNFFMDIYEEPELIKQVFDLAQAYNLEVYTNQLKMAKGANGAWVGGWRAAPELLNHDMWMEFVWPYLKPLVLTTIDHGVIPILHFDSNWDSELETLKELPAKKCILMLDGSTDIRKAREVLDERMCIMGDVPATLLAFGTADEVYNYTTKLIDDVGPKTGLIVSSGCDNPLNAIPENVKAMIDATVEYSV